jgi:DNA-binding transcriptional LysR family regulator
MILTPRAEHLIGPVRAALHEAAHVLDPRPFDPATDERVVTMAITTSTAFTFIPLLIATLAERAPHVTLRLRTSDMSSPTVFTDDEVDLVLLPEAFRSPYPRQRLYDDRLVVLASASVPRYPDIRTMLSAEEHIVFDGGPAFQAQGYDLLAKHGVDYHVYATVSDYLLVPHLVASGRFVSTHRLQVAVKFRGAAPLRIEPFPYPVSLGIDIVWNPWLTDTVFRDWLAGVLHEAARPLADPQRGAGGPDYASHE